MRIQLPTSASIEGASGAGCLPILGKDARAALCSVRILFNIIYIVSSHRYLRSTFHSCLRSSVYRGLLHPHTGSLQPLARAVQASLGHVHLLQRRRVAEPVALGAAAAQLQQAPGLGLGLDPLGHDRHAESLGHVQYRRDDGGILGRLHQVAHEGLVDLQAIERQAAQVRQR